MAGTEGSGRRRAFVITAVVVILALVGGGAYFFTRDSEASASVTLVGAKDAGPDPFTASVAIGPAVTLPGNVQAIATAAARKDGTDPATGTVVSKGTAPGLYGGSGDTKVCEPDKLVAYLQQNPAKAKAWARVFGIAPSGIAKYVGGLSPVVLIRDTLVTNHGFRNGSANAFQAVLQAGTAVMVDSRGTPRVKCGCGNPLAPPGSGNLGDADTTGARWSGYAPGNVTIVQPGAVTVNLTLVNVRTGDTFTQPVGGDEGVFAVAETPNISAAAFTRFATSPDGRTWTEVSKLEGALADRVVTGLAYGQGTWVAVTMATDRPSLILTSPDLRTWTTANQVSSDLKGVTFANGRWVAVGSSYTGSQQDGTIVTSTDGKAWTTAYSVPGVYLSQAAYGQGRWMAVGAQGTKGLPLLLTSTDGTHWDSPAGELPDPHPQAIAFAEGKWQLGGERSYVSTDGRTWKPTTGGDRFSAYAYGNGTWLAVRSVNGEENVSTSGTFFTSADGASWTRRSQIPYAVWGMAYGRAGGLPATTTTTTRPSGSNKLEDGTYELSSSDGTKCGLGNPIGTLTVSGTTATWNGSDGKTITGTVSFRGTLTSSFLVAAGPDRTMSSVNMLGTVERNGSISGRATFTGFQGSTPGLCEATFTGRRK
jgi:hypothetical protein